MGGLGEETKGFQEGVGGERGKEGETEGKRERARRVSERTEERERRHRTSIVDIDIIIVHRKAGRVGSCATVGLCTENAFYRPEVGRRAFACTCGAQGGRARVENSRWRASATHERANLLRFLTKTAELRFLRPRPRAHLSHAWRVKNKTGTFASRSSEERKGAGVGGGRKRAREREREGHTGSAATERTGSRVEARRPKRAKSVSDLANAARSLEQGRGSNRVGRPGE